MTGKQHEGGCACGAVRYRLSGPPIFVHCCHCRWCQRESGSAFALNAMIETRRVTVEKGKPEVVLTPTQSGRGQKYMRCPTCQVALWSHYAGLDEKMSFIRVGTLDDPDSVPPDIHIFTSSKQPWVVLPDNVPAVPEYYKKADYWSEESQKRFQALLAE